MKQSVSAIPTPLAALTLFASMVWGVALANDVVIQNGRVIDPETGLAFHSVFEQKGTVVNGEKTSQIDHQVVMTLLDAAQGGEQLEVGRAA